MKLLFPTLLTMPSNKVHGIQVAHMCDGFVKAGAVVEFLVPHDSQIDQVFSHYHLDTAATVVPVRTIGSVRWGWLGYRVRVVSFALGCWWYARRQQADVLFSREALPALLCARSVKKTIWEIHNEDINWFVRRVMRAVDIVIAISPALRDLCQKLGTPAEKIKVVVNAVSEGRFKEVEQYSKEQCRRTVSLPLDKKLIVFTGNAVGWKGVETLAAATFALPDDALVVFVGRVSLATRTTLESVGDVTKMLFVGEQPYTDMPLYQRAADILVLPTSGRTERARLYTSPIKLFEYMLSGVPMVVTDIESTRAVVSDGVATFAEPDDASALAAACLWVLKHPIDSRQKADRAKLLGQQHSWPNRGRAIMATVSG